MDVSIDGPTSTSSGPPFSEDLHSVVCTMKAISCLLLVVLISFTDNAASDFDYRGQIFIRKTSLDDREYAELETGLIITSESPAIRKIGFKRM